MSHNIPDKVLHRASKDVYRTRFLMQNDTPKKTHNKSELIALMGGTPVLDLLAIALCERIRRNRILDPVYGGISLKSLIPLQTELLSYALADTYPATAAGSKSNILSKHCKLGLMVEPEYFDQLYEECIRAMCHCIQDEELIMECGKKFGQVHGLLLQEMHLQLRMLKSSSGRRGNNNNNATKEPKAKKETTRITSKHEHSPGSISPGIHKKRFKRVSLKGFLGKPASFSLNKSRNNDSSNTDAA